MNKLSSSNIFWTVTAVGLAFMAHAGVATASEAVKESAGAGHASLGSTLPLWSMLPFMGMLLSIALFPLFAPKFWHDNFGKVSMFWSLVVSVPFLYVYRVEAMQELLHIIILDYLPFLILLAALYVISGNILLKGRLSGTPAVNTIMLAVGTALASWMGTTGAAMLMIRPFIRANSHRGNRVFMIVFFIFLVANIGGSLTPLGDPPLFLGFLRGVPFFWTFNIFPEMLVVSAVLLIVYYLLDSYHYRKEGKPVAPEVEGNTAFRLVGSYNFIFLLGIVFAVLASGMLKLPEVSFLGLHIGLQEFLRMGVMLLMGGLSLAFTPARVREENNFTWFPIREIAVLFIGIFLTMVPCLKILNAGSEGSLAFIIENVKEPAHYFWITGVLSSFLDNAPTYLTFLSTVLGRFYPGAETMTAVHALIAENAIYLKAISTGAVFFGACTYIGNAPNFMVRSIAEEAGIRMPSFFGYMLKYSIIFLVPLFVLVTFIFFL